MATMTTSTMTEGQIERALEIFRAKLRKRASELPSDAVQQAFGQAELSQEWFEVLRRHAEVFANLIVRKVTVDRKQTRQQVLDATGRAQYVDKTVLETMPQCEGDEVEVVFFPLQRFLTPTELEHEYAIHGLMPDPYAQAKVNEDDPSFADTHPNATQWDVSDGQSSYIAFFRWCVGKRGVGVRRRGAGWNADWWLGGVRKCQHQSLGS